MKKLIISGFSLYVFFHNTISNELTCKNTATGEDVTLNNKGKFSLTATEDNEDAMLKAGDIQKFSVDEILSLTGWDDVTSGGVTVEKTADQIAADELRAKLKAKKSELESLKKSFLTLPQDELFAAIDKAKSLQTEIDELSTELKPAAAKMTPECEAAVAIYDSKLEQYKAMLSAATDFKNNEVTPALETARSLGYKKSTGGSGVSDPSKAGGKLSYEMIQAMRKSFSEGMKVSEIAEIFGCSVSVVNYKINYLQGKLRRDDARVEDVTVGDRTFADVSMNFDYTPLTNDYYPEGAPYLEDKVREDDSRYTKAANRK